MRTLKVMMIGLSSSKKFDLIRWYCGDVAKSGDIGNAYRTKMIKINDEKTKLAIHDTCGQKEYLAMVKLGMRRDHSKALIFVYNPADRDSFDLVKEYVAMYHLDCSAACIVENISAANGERVVGLYEAIELADSYEVGFCRVLSDGHGVEKPFLNVLSKVFTSEAWQQQRESAEKIREKAERELPIKFLLHLVFKGNLSFNVAFNLMRLSGRFDRLPRKQLEACVMKEGIKRKTQAAESSYDAGLLAVKAKSANGAAAAPDAAAKNEKHVYLGPGA